VVRRAQPGYVAAPGSLLALAAWQSGKRFVFLLITRLAAWPRLSRREEAWKTQRS
jgi:hypothetical protein